MIPLQADVTDNEAITAIAAKIEEEQGYINLLINNAGIMANFLPKQLPKDIKDLQSALWSAGTTEELCITDRNVRRFWHWLWERQGFRTSQEVRHFGPIDRRWAIVAICINVVVSRSWRRFQIRHQLLEWIRRATFSALFSFAVLFLFDQHRTCSHLLLLLYCRLVVEVCYIRYMHVGLGLCRLSL